MLHMARHQFLYCIVLTTTVQQLSDSRQFIFLTVK